MKVVIVNDYARVNGGAAKVALQSAVGLAKRGHAVEFFAGIGPPIPQLAEHGIRVTCLDGVPYNHDPRIIHAACRGIWDWEAAHRLRALLNECNPQDTVVHFHTFRDALSASVAHTAHRMDFVTFYTAHEYTMGCPYGGFFDIRKNRICELKGLSARCLACRCNNGSHANKLWYCANQFVYAKIARIPALLDHIIHPSNTNRNVLQAYIPGGRRTTTLSYLFDPMEGRPASIDSSSPFLFVGSFVPHKDPLTAARAAKRLHAPMLFIGSGILEGQIHQIYPEAEITGWLDRNAIAKRMATARALLFPSIWHEAQPLTVMEAAASGLSIIAADASAATEELDLLETGEVFRSGDADDLTAKMAPYLNDSYARERGAAAFAAFRRIDLSEERHISRLLDIYAEVLAQRRI
jgi:glycosyltransferase involved in cell wall biosynthesis